MSKQFDQMIEDGYLLQICQESITEVCKEAETLFGLKSGDVKALTYGNAKTVKSTVIFRGEIVFEVSFLAADNMGYFFYMTKEQAREAFADFFRARGGKAA